MALPLWLLKALSPFLRRSADNLLSVFILLPLIVIAILLIVEAGNLFRNGESLRATSIVAGIGAFLFGFVLITRIWSKWTSPRVPEEDDVDRVRMDGASGAVHSVTNEEWEENSEDGKASKDEWAENREDDMEADAPEPIYSSPSFLVAPPPPERADLAAVGGPWFRDGLGRAVLLRGVNVTGCCKLPAGVTDDDRKLTDWRDVTFVGRPFPLDEADVHLSRLRAWGLTFLRLLYTWEAVEHAGPGIYDEEYLDYLVALCRKCREYGMSVFLDCHQDCWSRFTGGSGAPAWTLIKVGFDLERLEESGAAFTDCGIYSKEKGGEGIPRMAWNSNNARIAAGTMWTLFFAGNDFAPETQIDGEPAQEYLQGRFCAMLERVAQAVKDEPNVVGFDVLNEPSVGFVDVKDARDISSNQFLIGWRVDVWSAIKLGAGFPQKVDFFESFMVYGGKRTLNPKGIPAWKVECEGTGSDMCIWRKNGVWDLDEEGKPALKDPAYFARNPRTGNEIDFMDDYAIPFFDQAQRAIRKHMSDAIIFIEPVLDMYDTKKSEQPFFTKEQAGSRGLVWAKHFYDGITLLSAGFSRLVNANPVTQAPVVGLGNIQRSFGRTLADFKQESSKMGPGGAPVLIGECGIPFNMPSNRQFRNLARCTAALNTTMRAIEIGLVSCTIWTYCPVNSNARGDDWNGEDLSLYSSDQVVDPNDLHSGGRSLAAAVRPYALRTAGEPLSMSFDPYRRNRRFAFSFCAGEGLSTKETVIFLPRYQYPHGATIFIKEGKGEYVLDWAMQQVTYIHTTGGVHTLIVTKNRRK